MRVLIAGATGAIGRPLVSALTEAGHQVLALTRNARATIPGATTVVADVLNRDDLLRAVEGHSADVVIHQLTALSKAPAMDRPGRGHRGGHRGLCAGTHRLGQS
jgi:uncharacterized protein YbjT (DUF2867 family)